MIQSSFGVGVNSLDSDLLRTFLEVYRTRHFGRASRTLFITQSAISTRIKQLEEQLKVTLFTRKRNDIQLTEAGKRFLPSAQALLKLWEEARKNVVCEDKAQPRLRIGAHSTLWETILPPWLATLRRECDSMTLLCETHHQEALFVGLLEGRLDVGFCLDPPKSKALLIREMVPFELIMVSAKPVMTAQKALFAPGHPYILLEWDPLFLQEHAQWYPSHLPPFLHTDQARMAHEWLLNAGGSGYLARNQIEAELVANRLFLVEDAMVGKRMVYGVYVQAGQNRLLVEEALSHWSGS